MEQDKYLLFSWQEFNLNAHIFLITGLTGKGPVRKQEVSVFSHQECEERIKQGCADDVMLRWSEVQEMRDSGLVEFHLHTHTHQRWDRVDSIQSHLEFLKAEILLGRECMKAMLGNCSRHLCWPEGYYTHEYIQVAKALGFSYLYTTERRMNSPVTTQCVSGASVPRSVNIPPDLSDVSFITPHRFSRPCWPCIKAPG